MTEKLSVLLRLKIYLRNLETFSFFFYPHSFSNTADDVTQAMNRSYQRKKVANVFDDMEVSISFG